MGPVENQFNEEPRVLECPSCGADNESDSNFCEQCGEPFKTVLICEKCKSENDAEAKYCAQCGRPLETPEYLKKQNRKLKIGFIFLFLFFLVLGIYVVMTVLRGTRFYSTKDFRWRNSVTDTGKR